MKEIFIEGRSGELRIAIKKDGELFECYFGDTKKEPLPGHIYKGIVKNIVPAIKCAFIDIGYEKNAYLYLDNRENLTLKKGDEIIVEVLKEEIEDKGAKVTSAFTIPGRYSVLLSKDNSLYFSSKLHNEVFKEELKNNLSFSSQIGLMIRTNSIEATMDEIQEEADYLYGEYKEIKKNASYSIKPKLLYEDDSLLRKVCRDLIDKNVSKIIVDNKEHYNEIKSHLNADALNNLNIEIYDGHRSLFDIEGIEHSILTLRNNKVSLHCGGHIVIDKTTAMNVIDVNTGNNVKSRTMDKTVAHTNIEAAKEIVRQIRLRNLSGIILIDFVDVKDKKVKDIVTEILEDGFKDDKNKTIIYPPTELNLVQIARRRRGKAVSEYIEEPCVSCSATGHKINFKYLSLLVRNEILKSDNNSTIKDIYIEINKYYEEKIKGNILDFITDIEALDKKIYIKFCSEIENFKVEPLLFKNQIENVEKYRIYL